MNLEDGRVNKRLLPGALKNELIKRNKQRPVIKWSLPRQLLIDVLLVAVYPGVCVCVCVFEGCVCVCVLGAGQPRSIPIDGVKNMIKR
jgi:hypothetical protein